MLLIFAGSDAHVYAAAPVVEGNGRDGCTRHDRRGARRAEATDVPREQSRVGIGVVASIHQISLHLVGALLPMLTSHNLGTCADRLVAKLERRCFGV